ncbi:potassium-transporting ATPase subunit KdpA, partial [Deinococcus wulumuqiensis]|uniref:potassium-transporting ATPase subunit KdpA n=1 Tax=Deinococcus wulumuqiensis TaxID=980427 RepID=UPI0035ECC08C
ANNGSAFAGARGEYAVYNLTIGFSMLIGPLPDCCPCWPSLECWLPSAACRLVLAPCLRHRAVWRTHRRIILIVVALTFLPALTLGPIADHLQMLKGVVLK